jgi:hypothetical protein
MVLTIIDLRAVVYMLIVQRVHSDDTFRAISLPILVFAQRPS